MSELATRKIKLNNGKEIPQVGFGTFEITEEDAERSVREAIEVGYRHIDCAQAYWNQTEVGKGLKAIDRDALWLTSKLWRPDMPGDKVEAACDHMLKELAIDHLDLWLIHWPDAAIPFEETLGAMQKCVEKGKIGALGVCNAMDHHLDKIEKTGIPIAMNQFEIHPYLYQKELIQSCWDRGLAVTAYSPIARGEALKDETIASVAKRHNKTSAQVCLRWLLQKGLVVIPKSVHRERMEQYADIFDFELSEGDIAQLDSLDKGYRTILPDFSEFSTNET